LDAEKGTERWSSTVPGGFGKPVLINETIYADGGDGRIHALNTATGVDRRHSAVVGTLVAIVGSTLCASDGTRLYAIEAPF
jgi:outer membrane protein assembly factor BamB